MMKEALIVFVRKPEKGKVKTRLAATAGEEAALYIYQKLLAHTAAVAAQAGADLFVFYADEIDEADLWDEWPCIKRKQAPTDLGGRMKAAFDTVFSEGYSRVVIIGSDCPGLSALHIRKAIEGLQTCEVVIGPATDGGYYLLAMKRLHPALFENMAWSTNAVYRQTLAVLHQHHLSFFSLPRLTDVDEEKDLPPEWREEISALVKNDRS